MHIFQNQSPAGAGALTKMELEIVTADKIIRNPHRMNATYSTNRGHYMLRLRNTSHDHIKWFRHPSFYSKSRLQLFMQRTQNLFWSHKIGAAWFHDLHATFQYNSSVRSPVEDCLISVISAQCRFSGSPVAAFPMVARCPRLRHGSLIHYPNVKHAHLLQQCKCFFPRNLQQDLLNGPLNLSI